MKNMGMMGKKMGSGKGMKSASKPSGSKSGGFGKAAGPVKTANGARGGGKKNY